ncbi:sigma-54 dependent transcriptional regulator [Candidatus Hydrogenedentota bacterium]
MSRVLVAETMDLYRANIANSLRAEGFTAIDAPTSDILFSELSAEEFDVVLLDVSLLRDYSVEPLAFIREKSPSCEVIILSDPEDVDIAVDALHKGAYLYFIRSSGMDDLLLMIRKALDKKLSSERFRAYERESFESLFGHSFAMNKVLNMVSKVAPTDSTVLLLGESGTGKEILADMIHRLSRRADAPFVALNCSALPETLLESELFGYVKGAFTGADTDKHGLFEEADGGTIFLDEIGDMPVMTQVKLLRVLQNGEIRRLGETKATKVDVRVVAATNKDLQAAIANKEFREDLYFRLNVIQLKLPPLRDRMDALPNLVRHFIREFNPRFGKDVRRIADAAQYVLAHYTYPGNVRELENIIEHAVILSEGGVIRIEDLPDYVTIESPILQISESAGRSVGKEEEFLTLDEMEKRLIKQTLMRCSGNQTVASEKLGISRSTLWRKIKQHEITF